MLLFRRFFEHPYWTEKRVYSRAEAWLDCWANMAAWADHKKLVGSRQVDLKRGEFLASDRFLMKRWGWSRGKVRRWIEAATEANEIRPTSETSDGTIYLVVNYGLMQPGGTSLETETVPPSDQDRTKDNEGNKGNEEKDSNPPTPLNPAAREVVRLCEANRSPWKLKAGIEEWANGLPKDYPNVRDFDRHIRECSEWWQNQRKTMQAPDRAIRNWLKNAERDATNERRNTGGSASESRGQATGTDGHRRFDPADWD